MIRRWRSIVHPETADRMRPQTAGEAAALWFLGSAWLLYGTWLACAGLPLWLPAIPVAGLLAMWGWKRRGWLFWFPAAAAVAALLDARLEGTASCHLLDVAMTGMALVVVARGMARGWPRRALGPGGRLLCAALAAGAVVAVVDPRGETPRVLRVALVGLASFAAAWRAAQHPGIVSRAQQAFPIAAVVLGTTTLVAWGARQVPTHESVAIGTMLTLAAALPFTWAMAVQPGRRGALQLASAVVGSLALGSQVAALLTHNPGAHLLAEPPALTLLGTVVVVGASGGTGRALAAGGEHWRVGVTVVFAVLAATEGDPRFLAVAVVLAATAAGLGWGGAARLQSRDALARRHA
jgi:hypothetical protein